MCLLVVTYRDCVSPRLSSVAIAVREHENTQCWLLLSAPTLYLWILHVRVGVVLL